MKTLALLAGFRVIDNFFPSGGYAFSSGLEAAVQHGAVQTAADLSAYVEDVLRNGIGRCDAVAVVTARDAVVTNRLSPAEQADRELNAMKFSRETRQASRQIGRQVFRTALGRADVDACVMTYWHKVEVGQLPGHHAVAIGLVLGACGWAKHEAAAAFLYQAAVGYISAALKLLPIGQREGQQLLAGWLPVIDDVGRKAAGQSQLSSWSPIQDIYSMRHARLPVRLFRS